MKAHQLWSTCGILVATVALASCTKEQMEQLLQNTTQAMVSGGCPPGAGHVSPAPEFCLYVTELRVVNRDTEANVSATIVNRTGRRLYLTMVSQPFLTDSSGTKWANSNVTGIGGTPLSLEPNVDSQIAFSFNRSGSGQAPADLTFSMRGEVAILKVDSRGELLPKSRNSTVRGFNFTGVPQVQQRPAQLAAASGLQGSTSLEQQSKEQKQLGTTPKNESANTGNTTPASSPGGSFVPLKAADFPERGQSLLNQQVELSGNFYSPILVNPKSDFSRGLISNPSVDPRRMDAKAVTVVFDLVDKQTISWMARNMCREVCKNVFVRGRLVTRKGHRQPVLEMTQISFESVAGAEAGGSAEAKLIAAQDRYGTAKAVLPSGAIPTEEGWKGWADRIPSTAPGYDAARGMWKSMIDHSDYQRQAAWDQERAIVRGPDRPADFETYYRGVRDTGLSDLFKPVHYQDRTTVWPRVALIVEERPQKGGIIADEYNRGGKTTSDRCWRLRAKVWTGSARSEDITPFNWCLSEMRYNIGYAGVARWGMSPTSNMARIQANTGSKRTTGPNPPGTPLPQPLYMFQFSYDTIMVGNVLLDMGFSFHVPDGRVWLIDESVTMQQG